MRRFLILHGWQNRRPVEHWQHWLAGELSRRGYDVRYPQLPSPDRPALKDWLAAISVPVERPPGTDLSVVCHSLSCAAWLHFAAQGSVHLPVSQLLFVAPPSRRFLRATAELAEFELDATAHRVARASSLAAPRLA